MFRKLYKTPEGFDDLMMTSDGESLTALSFIVNSSVTGALEETDVPVFAETKEWLDGYFRGAPPRKLPRIELKGLTPFCLETLEIIQDVPFGETTTYGGIAKQIAQKRGIGRMSAQAVGGALGSNPVCIIIPCHRVMGADGSPTGYAGGINNKIALLEHEQTNKYHYRENDHGTYQIDAGNRP